MNAAFPTVGRRQRSLLSASAEDGHQQQAAEPSLQEEAEAAVELQQAEMQRQVRRIVSAPGPTSRTLSFGESSIPRADDGGQAQQAEAQQAAAGPSKGPAAAGSPQQAQPAGPSTGPAAAGSPQQTQPAGPNRGPDAAGSLQQAQPAGQRQNKQGAACHQSEGTAGQHPQQGAGQPQSADVARLPAQPQASQSLCIPVLAARHNTEELDLLSLASVSIPDDAALEAALQSGDYGAAMQQLSFSSQAGSWCSDTSARQQPWQ